MDQCGSKLYLEDELSAEEITRLDGAAPKRFEMLYTVYGQTVQSLIQIDEDCCMLIAGYKDSFKGLKTNLLFKTEESAN